MTLMLSSVDHEVDVVATPVPTPEPLLSAAKTRLAVALLTLTAFGIRLVVVRGFWLDEATSGYDSRLSYSGMLRALEHDNHPPLDYSILWAVAHTIGSTQTDLRLPSFVFGALMVPMLYLAGTALYDRRAGLLAAAFGTVGPLAVWYGQEARMYALFMLLAVVTIWAMSRALQTDRRRYWAAWALAGAAMIWTQWFASLAVGAEVLVFATTVISHRRHGVGVRRLTTHVVVSVLAVVVTVAPSVPLLVIQFHNNQANGLGFGGHSSGASTDAFSPYGILTNLVWAWWGYHSNGVISAAVAIWPLGLLAVLIFLGRQRSLAHRQLLALLVIPMALIFVGSAKAAPGRSLFEIRYFIEAVPILYLLLAGATWTLSSSTRVRRIVAGALLGSLVVGLVLQQTDADNPRLYAYDAAFAQIGAHSRPGDEILYAPTFLNIDVDYFAPHTHSAPVADGVPSRAAGHQIFVFTSLGFTGVGNAPSQAGALVSRLETTRHLNWVFNAPNVEVWAFSS